MYATSPTSIHTFTKNQISGATNYYVAVNGNY